MPERAPGGWPVQNNTTPPFNAAMILMDESASMPEQEWYVLNSAFPNAFVRTMTGDWRQKPLMVPSANGHWAMETSERFWNVFGPQLLYFLIERLSDGRHPIIRLFGNHRARAHSVPNLLSHHHYGGLLPCKSDRDAKQSKNMSKIWSSGTRISVQRGCLLLLG